jgi:hypothetical protein
VVSACQHVLCTCGALCHSLDSDRLLHSPDALVARYASVARLLSVTPREIAIVDSSTAAYTKVMYGVHLERNDVMISVGESEYAANAVSMLQHTSRNGAKVGVTLDHLHLRPRFWFVYAVNAVSMRLCASRKGDVMTVALKHIHHNAEQYPCVAHRAAGDVLRQCARIRTFCNTVDRNTFSHVFIDNHVQNHAHTRSTNPTPALLILCTCLSLCPRWCTRYCSCLDCLEVGLT